MMRDLGIGQLELLGASAYHIRNSLSSWLPQICLARCSSCLAGAKSWVTQQGAGRHYIRGESDLKQASSHMEGHETDWGGRKTALAMQVSNIQDRSTAQSLNTQAALDRYHHIGNPNGLQVASHISA